MNYDNEYWHYKSIRDPLYGFIHLSERETKLLGTPYMHRLSRIKQLAHSYLVYPSAVHTRLEHSLGVLHTADRLCTSFHIGGERREIIRCAALLHDCGHGPYSHIFEKIIMRINHNNQFSHEAVTQAIIRGNNEMSDLLRGKVYGHSETLPDIHEDVLDLHKSNSVDKLGRSIISGSVDADKLDYLRRDSYHTGTAYGLFDLERILATLRTTTDPITNFEFPVIRSERDIPAFESFRLARYLLHTQVVLHHVRTIADSMFLRSLELAVFDEHLLSEDLFRFYDNEEEFIKSYFDLDDFSIYQLVINSSKNVSNSKAGEIMQDLKNRRLFKRAYEKDLTKIPSVDLKMLLWRNSDVNTTNDLESSISTASGIDCRDIIVYSESEKDSLKSYRSSGSAMEAGEMPMLYLDGGGTPRPYEDRSPLAINKDPNRKLYVFTREAYRKQIEEVCPKIFGG